MKLWSRFLFWRLMRTWICFFTGIFCFYLLIDVLASFKRISTIVPWSLLPHCFFFRACLQGFLLLILSCFLAIFFINIQLQRRLEGLSLLTSGIPRRSIFSAHLIFSCILSILCIGYQEFAYPWVEKQLCFLTNSPSLGQVHTLSNNSVLVFAKQEQQVLHQVYWITGEKKIWRMERLELGTAFSHKEKLGLYVDLFEKNRNGFLEKTGSWEKKAFPKIPQFSLAAGNLRKIIDHFFLRAPCSSVLLLLGCTTIIKGLFPFLGTLLICCCAPLEKKAVCGKQLFFSISLLIFLGCTQQLLLHCAIAYTWSFIQIMVGYLLFLLLVGKNYLCK